MKRIGLIGGISWTSTALYYEKINSWVNSKLGAHYSADIILHSLNFEDTVQWVHQGKWDLLAKQLKYSAKLLSQSGANYFLMCCNTAHKVYNEISEYTSIPCIHIMSPIAEIINHNKYTKVGILGTDFTMINSFHKDYIKLHTGINLAIPDMENRSYIHKIIFSKLCHYRSKHFDLELQERINIFANHHKLDAIILACTELIKGINPQKIDVPILDSTESHAIRAAELALAVENNLTREHEVLYEFAR